MSPVIGILFCGYIKNRQFVSAPYIEAVSDAGGIPLIIPYPGREICFSKYFQLCDGFLFCGGGDISPLLFGENLITKKGATDWKTDNFHLHFMQHVLAFKLPVLGICRGMQVLNLALGGSIYQDISLRPEKSLNHMQLSFDRSDVCHRISISKSSLLYPICGEAMNVNSFHHQCIRSPGETLKVTAIAPDGVIEAVESSVFPFAVGLQWHPECMYLQHESMKKLFLYFIKISKKERHNFQTNVHTNSKRI